MLSQECVLKTRVWQKVGRLVKGVGLRRAHDRMHR